jgi:hypothetical protein
MEGYDFISPDHYKDQQVETIEKIERIWGIRRAFEWCEVTAFKYRDRIGKKPGENVEREVGKILWYENKAKELRERYAKQDH